MSPKPTHTKQAIDHGKMGHADVLTTHAEAALTHAQAGEKAKANPHCKEAIKHLEQAIDEGKKGGSAGRRAGCDSDQVYQGRASGFRAQNRLDFRRIVRIGVVMGWPSKSRPLKGSPRDLWGFGSCEHQFRRREPTEPKPMSSLSLAKSRNPKSAAPKKGSAKSNATARRKVPSTAATPKKPLRSVKSKAERVAAAKTPVKADEPKVERLTKQERVLTLLSQPDGASIEEMMQATDWQQHSVRGFLAGTVKKKLSFSLTSLKLDDGVRRYRIETRRAR